MEIPTQSLPLTPVERTAALAVKVRNALWRRLVRPPQPATPPLPAPPAGMVATGLSTATTQSDFIFDLSRIDEVGEMVFCRLLDRVIARALGGNDSPAFLVFENHTKCLGTPGHFRRIEAVLAHLNRRHGRHVAFVTLREMAENLHRLQPGLAV